MVFLNPVISVVKIFLGFVSMNQAFEKHLTVCKDTQTLLDLLSENCPQISKQKLKLAMKYGAVWLTSSNKKNKTTRIRRAKKVLQLGDEVHLYYDESILFAEITPAKLISDEGEYSAWDKPCRMFSQGTKWSDHSSIARWVELFGLDLNRLQLRPTFLVHRLDRATNGLILVAHSKKAASLLTALFENKMMKKHYSALVKGDYLTKGVLRMDADIDGKSASTVVLSSEYQPDKDQTALLLEINTGRKHQIRKHLSGAGFSIVGDRLYGNMTDEIEEHRINEQPDLMLRSCHLEFTCPFSQDQRIYQLMGY